MAIVASAIKLSDGRVFTAPRPGRHCHAIGLAVAAGLERVVDEVQGFMTDNGRFLDRDEAGRHAIEAGQIAALKWPHMGLNSEDVW